MISESQERMCAAVLPEKWDAVREVCERWGLPVAVIGRVTADGDITVVTGGLEPDGRRAAGARELARIPARALTSDAIVHQRVAAPPTHQPRRPGTGCAGRGQRPAPRARDGPGRGPARAARVGQPRLAPRRLPPVRLDGRRGHGRRARAAAPRSCASRARRKALVATTDGNQAVGAVDPWLGAALVGRRGDPQRVDHGRPSARRHELPQLRRPDPAGGVLAADRGRPRRRRRVPGARAAGDRRQRLALQRVAGRGDRADRRRSGSSACSTTSTRSSARPSSRSHDAVLLVGDVVPGLVGSAYAALAGAATEDDPPALDLGPRGRRPGVRPRGDRPRPGRLGPGRLGRRPGRRPRRMRDVGRARRDGPDRGRPLAGGRPVRREPVAAGPDLPAALRRGARAAGPPARPPGRADRARSAATASSSSWRWPARPATSRTAAAASPTRSRSRCATSATPGITASARALGWEG